VGSPSRSLSDGDNALINASRGAHYGDIAKLFPVKESYVQRTLIRPMLRSPPPPVPPAEVDEGQAANRQKLPADTKADVRCLTAGDEVIECRR